MKTSTTNELSAVSIDQRSAATSNTASSIVNMRYDDNSAGFLNDRGFEPYIPLTGHSDTLTNTENYTRIFFWERHRGAEVYPVVKRGNQLLYEVNNPNGLAGTEYKPTHILSFNRTEAKADDPDEQFVPFGRMLLVLNGKDPMLKFWGRDRVEHFGFTTTTPMPQLLAPDPDYFDGTCALDASPPASNYPYARNDSFGGIAFDDGDGAGLGDKDDDQVSHYRYKVTFITDTGSESPLSGAAQVSWRQTSQGNTYPVYFQYLPQGPVGTVARRIYRTKCLKGMRSDNVGENYYLVAQVNENVSRNYMDVTPDDLLVVPAPTTLDSHVLSTGYRYAASWDGRMWLAGGQGTETKVIYSEVGKPEQFGVLSYFDVGNKEGGAITALVPHYDNLLVFREHSIEVLRQTSSGYVCTTLHSSIGTTATNTITNIPSIGVVFLSYDGVYAFKGGTIGGSQVSLVKVSEPIQDEMNRLSKASIARAKASFSTKEKEWWCLYPVDGGTFNTRSVVLHVTTGGWSFRHDLEDGEANFVYNDIAVAPGGWFVLAPRMTTVLENGAYSLFPNGLQVWSARRSGGESLRYLQQQQTKTITGVTYKPQMYAQWQSAWLDLGDSSLQKQYLSVEVEVLTWGHNEVQLLVAKDFSDDETSMGSRPTAYADSYATSSEDALYGPTVFASGDKSPATLGTSKWAQRRPARVRWDVQTGNCNSMRFTIKSNSTFQVVSYQLEYVVAGRKTTLNIKP